MRLNGPIAFDVVDDKNTSGSGAIVLFGGKDKCEYRKMDIRELAPIVPDVPIVADTGFTPLFNGKDLTGWKSPPADADDWRWSMAASSAPRRKPTACSTRSVTISRTFTH